MSLFIYAYFAEGLPRQAGGWVGGVCACFTETFNTGLGRMAQKYNTQINIAMS